jgi:hypothetical protein
MTDRAQPEPMDALAALGHDIAPPPAVSLASSSLADLFDQARALVLRPGELHESPRGPTRSLNGVMLTWLAAERDTTPPEYWRREEIDWYLATFIAKRHENDPARLAQAGALVFPYTYAARARFWDGGWGYLHALTDFMWNLDYPVERVVESRAAFEAFLAAVGERLHLQTVLSLWALHGPDVLRHWLANQPIVAEMLTRWRRDLLAAAIADIAATPQSRRAVVAALSYPQLEDQLRPRMGLPPYQLFQYLPGEAGGPLSSIHVHRSLDLDGGAPLDFYHDLAWLREAGIQTGRLIGDISVVAHNLHIYLRPDETAGNDRKSIREWLCRVTDGYETGAGAARELLTQPAYRANLDRIWAGIQN